MTVGKDVATSVEVHWPDGRSAARPLVPSDLNSVLEIQYPRDVEVTPTAQIQVHVRRFSFFFGGDFLKKLDDSVPERRYWLLQQFYWSSSPLSPTMKQYSAQLFRY